ncbi:MAG: thioesterase family protein [Verrucomicrobiales bacterium]
MPAIFDYQLIVGPGDIDKQGHVNNVEYIRWMQQAAVAHSDAQGWDSKRYAQIGGAWFVRSHSIEYLIQALKGDAITIRTWVASLERVRSIRKFRFERENILLARAETLWVWIDLDSGRLRPVPVEVAGDFEVTEFD